MNNIKKLRILKGFTLNVAAEKLNISRTSLCNIEKQEHIKISKSLEERLCNLYNVTSFELYGFDVMRCFPQNKNEALRFIKAFIKKYKIELLELYD